MTTTTITTEEYSALLAVQRAATVIAAGEHVNEHEHEQALDALPHLLDAVAAEQSARRSAVARMAAADAWPLARAEYSAPALGVVTAIAGVDEPTRCECGSTMGPFVLDREGCTLCPDCAATSRWCGKRTWGGHCGLDVGHEGACVPDDEATRALGRERGR